jgi:adenylosuccinate synthase
MKIVPTFVGRHMNHSPLPEASAKLLYARTRERGRPEAGSVSGRERTYYWTSIPEIRAAIDTYDLNALVVAKIDIADMLPEIHLGMEYVFADGTRTTAFDPDDERMFDPQTRMNTLMLDGWQQSTAGLTSFEDAPRNLQSTIHSIAKLTGVPVIAFGTGPHFGEAVYARNSPFDILHI